MAAPKLYVIAGGKSSQPVAARGLPEIAAGAHAARERATSPNGPARAAGAAAVGRGAAPGPAKENVMAELNPGLDERKLDLIRAFLREHFRGLEMTDQFDFEKTAQRFTLGPGTNRVHSLIVTKEALESMDFAFLLNDQLVDALKLAGALPVTLTSKGPRY